MIYLDAAATTPVRREVLEAMWPLLTGGFGNPSSHHAVGEAAAAALASAREAVAADLFCRPAEVVFTSGGTEANNLALKGIALAAPRGRHIVTSAAEHAAVREPLSYLERFHGFRITVLPVDGAGTVDPEELAAALTAETTLCSVMYANNEVGTVQDIARLAGICRSRGVYFHTDAVQAAAWLPLDVQALGVDALSISGHKLGAPKGSGVLYLRRRVPVEPLIHGGGQERGRRSGTENVAGAVGAATALTAARRGWAAAAEASTALRDRLIAHVLAGVPGAVLTGHPERRLPNLASFCFPGLSGESVLLELERLGVVASSGSACAAGSDEPSAVLLALGLDADTATTALRLSWIPEATAADLEAAAAAVVEAVGRVRAPHAARI
ncbi:cysteine desulfurase [Arthrobacter crusticola]|uniref:cysteine desulfurase n=1 Tax=Arthrobacter crusticola TaxID=2547960 RepID=A0A4V3AMP3_9MICC|nr:cysteine desulfurase family protein [Arthrobacter crusticola]TDK27654.1 cysteine desulfurase [Arthrobacter crusticola]